MAGRAWARLLALLAALAAASRVAKGHVDGNPLPPLSPAKVYAASTSDGRTLVLAPSTAVHGTPLLPAGAPPLLTAAPEACGAECLAQGPACGWFQYCGTQGGCPDSGTGSPLVFQECRPLQRQCSLLPELHATSWPEQIISGFPARPVPQLPPGFVESAGQGIADADLECPYTAVPGKCAFNITLDAATLCVDMPACRALVVLLNGTDGCSAPLTIIKTEGPSPTNSFISPGVSTLQQLSSQPQEALHLYEQEGQVVLPPQVELAELAASSEDASVADPTRWLGCFSGSAVYNGDVLAVQDGVESAEACCRLCRQRSPAAAAPPAGGGAGGSAVPPPASPPVGAPPCTCFNYCPTSGSNCSFQSSFGDRELVSLAPQQCQLRHQELATPKIGWPLTVLGKGAGVPFIGGAPIMVWGPEVPGFERFIGRGLFTHGRFNCSGSLRAVVQECVKPGTVQQLAQDCVEDAQCAAFIMKPGGLLLSTPGVGIFKRDASPDKMLYTSTGIVYVRQQDSDAGLPPGAIAGIAAGSVAAAGALATGAWLFVRWARRPRRRQQQQQHDASPAEPGKSPFEALEAGTRRSGEDGSSRPFKRASTDGLVSPFQAAAAGASPFGASTDLGSVQLSPLGSSRFTSGAASSAGPLGLAVLPPAAAAATGAAAAGAVAVGAAAPGAAGAAPAGGPPAAPAAGRLFRAESAPPPRSAQQQLGAPGCRARRPPLHPSARAGSDPAAALAAAPARQTPAPSPLGGASWLAAPSTPDRSGLARQGPPVPSSSRLSPGPSGTAVPPALLSRSSTVGSLQVPPATSTLPSARIGSARGSSSSGSSSSSSGSQQEAPVTAGQQQQQQQQQRAALPELAQHVARQEAIECSSGLATAAGGSSSDESGEHELVGAGTLPPRLREWVVEPEAVQYLRWPNGKLQELGSGASAHVFKAVLSGEVVAAKEVQIGQSRQLQEAFLTEALRLHQLRHPHVVGFFGVSLTPTKGVVLMEFCEGRDLYSALQLTAAGSSQRLFGWYRRGRRVAHDIARALNYLHKQGVVHMDIKSSNVLLTAAGAAKLADVAFSRLQTGSVLSQLPLIGTFAWVAPEVLMGGRDCTSKLDLYSMGVVLWEIVTGERPQRGYLRQPHVPVECPQEVADLISACLRENPTERPTAQELLQRLSSLMERSASGGAGGGGGGNGGAGLAAGRRGSSMLPPAAAATARQVADPSAAAMAAREGSA